LSLHQTKYTYIDILLTSLLHEFDDVIKIEGFKSNAQFKCKNKCFFIGSRVFISPEKQGKCLPGKKNRENFKMIKNQM